MCKSIYEPHECPYCGGHVWWEAYEEEWECDECNSTFSQKDPEWEPDFADSPYKLDFEDKK